MALRNPLEGVEKIIWAMSAALADMMMKLVKDLFGRLFGRRIVYVEQMPSPRLPRSLPRDFRRKPGTNGGDGPDRDALLHPYTGPEHRFPGRDLLREMIPEYRLYKNVYIALKVITGVNNSEAERGWETLERETPDLMPLLRRFEKEGMLGDVAEDLKKAFDTVDTWHLARFSSPSLKFRYARAAAAEALTSRWRKGLADQAAHQARLEAAEPSELPPVQGGEDGQEGAEAPLGLAPPSGDGDDDPTPAAPAASIEI